jgi:pyruvate/2-oxoglutarate dehydrogenase complex dihydrolipoamide dehydrogenase (E3) component
MSAAMKEERYDAIIIGSGQAGTPLARALARAGWRTALIEREHVGGTCTNEGCTPTKTMVASARLAYLARRGGQFGVRTGTVEVDMRSVRERKRRIVGAFRGSGQQRLEEAAGLDLIFARARFIGPTRVEVARPDGTAMALAADTIVLNSGARPSRPAIAGIAALPALDSTSIMELDEVPDHLLVLGGGYIGLEFGQMFRRFGSRVTIVQRAEQLLPREDPDVADEITKILREDEVDVLLNATARCVEREADGRLALTVATAGAAERRLVGSHLLLAAGRVPNTDDLNLPAAGVRTDQAGYVPVDGKLRTNIAGIYAVGDVKGGPAFTHVSYDDFRVLKANLLDGGSATIDGRLIPYTVFIDPQLGRVGLSESEARRQRRDVRVFKMPMRGIARAVELDEARGFLKAVVDAATGQILGCAVLGIEGGELMSILQMAIAFGVPFTRVRDMIFAHPTLAEGLNNLFDED